MKQLITKDILNRMNSIVNSGKFKLKKYKFNPVYECIKIGRIDVVKVKDGYQLNLPYDINHIYISAWKADVGQMLVRDLRRYQGDNVYELTTKSEKALLRKIPADELEEMEDKKFNHLQIGDCMFTVLKAIPIDAYYCWYNDSEADPDETVNIEPANTISQEDIQYGDSVDEMSDSESIESAALF